MAVQTSDLTVTYAGLALGGSSSTYSLHDRYEIEQDYPTGIFACDVIVTAATKAALKTACNALEVAWRTPRQDFTLVNGSGNTFVTWGHSSNTGMNARPSCSKGRSLADGALSKLYTVRVEVDLPADLSGVSGRQSARIVTQYDLSRLRTVSITAVYTALGANSASAQAAASMSTFAASVRSDLGITTWELEDESTTIDDQNKRAEVSHTYRELLVNQSLGTLDDSQLKRPTFTIRRRRVAPGDFAVGNQKARRLIDVIVEYSAFVDATLTTNLATVWTGKVRPYLIQTALAAFGGSASAALIEETPLQEIMPGNRVGASMLLQVVDAGNLILYRYREVTEGRPGGSSISVWDGDSLAREPVRRAARLRQIREVTRRFVSGGSGGSTFIGIPAGQAGASWGGGFTSIGGSGGSSGSSQLRGYVESFSREIDPSVIGLEGHQLGVTEETVRSVVEYYKRGSSPQVVQGQPASPSAVPPIPGQIYAITATVPS